MDGWKVGDPIWKAGPFTLYSILMFCGFLCTFVSIYIHWRRQKYPIEILQTILILIVPSSILGARIWYVISEGLNGSSFWTFAGLSIQGGVSGAALVSIPYIFYKRDVIDPRTAIGFILPNVLLGQAIGRWGNFSNHEVFGGIVDGESLNWMTFLKSHMLIDGEYRAPFFLYEFFANFSGWLIIVWILINKSWIKPGSGAALYLVWYGTTRASMELFRDSDNIMTIFDTIPISFVLALISVFFGILFLIITELFTKPYAFPMSWAKVDEIFEKEYMIITPSKMTRKFWVFGKRMKSYRIWLPSKDGKWLKNKSKKIGE